MESGAGGVRDADGRALGRIELAVSAVGRWSESRHVRAEVARRAGCDLQPSELRLLEHFALVAPMRISDIADCMGIDISTASLQLRRLRSERLVERIRDESDLRVTLIAITEAGRDVVARVRAARRALLAEVFAGTDAAELDRAAEVLLRVQAHMLAGAAAPHV